MSKDHEFVFVDYGAIHRIGDTECAECWRGFPKVCLCGSLIHAEFLEEYWDDYALSCSCENCGFDFLEEVTCGY